LREIAGQWGFSKSSLERHKSHVSVAIERTHEKREERLGDNLHDEMKRVLDKAWALADKAEQEGDTRGAVDSSDNLDLTNFQEIHFPSKTNATLGTPANGFIVYCTDCTIANPCAGGGTGAVAKRINGAWVCN